MVSSNDLNGSRPAIRIETDMKMTVKWNANFERDLTRQIERSLSKVAIPVEVAAMDVEFLDDECRRILVYLDDHCQTSGSYIDYPDMAKRLDLEDNRVSLAYDRLEQNGLINLNKPLSGDKSAYIARDGRIAADDLRKLPEKQRQQAQVEAKQRRRKRLSYHYEKLVLPVIVAIVAVVIGWFANSVWNANSSGQPGSLTSENAEGSP